MIAERHRERERGGGERDRHLEQARIAGPAQDQVAEKAAERDRQQSGDTEERDAFGAAARRHDVGGLGEERREEHRLGDAVADADDVQPRSETVDRQIERADGDVQDAAGEDHDPAAFRVHHASDRRPRRDRGRRGDTEEKADLYLAGAELLQVAGQVQVEVEGEALQEVRGRREEERRRQQALARSERIRPLVVACGALRAGSCGCHCA